MSEVERIVYFWPRNGFLVSRGGTLALSWINFRTLSSSYIYNKSSVCSDLECGGGVSVPLFLKYDLLTVDLVELSSSLIAARGSLVVMVCFLLPLSFRGFYLLVIFPAFILFLDISCVLWFSFITWSFLFLYFIFHYKKFEEDIINFIILADCELMNFEKTSSKLDKSHVWVNLWNWEEYVKKCGWV